MSNSYVFEKHYGWNGMLIEPLARYYESLLNERKNCIILNTCVSNFTGFTKFISVANNQRFQEASGFDADMLSGIIDYWGWQGHVDNNRFSHKRNLVDIHCLKTQYIFDHFNISHIDYLSVDAEGAELSILYGIDWSKMGISVITVDNTSSEILHFLQSRGYFVVMLFHDLLAIKKDILL